MQKVAFVITKSEIGGAQSWVAEQVRLFRNDCNIILITSEYGWLTESISCDKIIVIPQLKKMTSIKAIYMVCKVLKENDIDIVVASSANAGLYSRLARVFMRFRCIYVSHGWSCLYNGRILKSLFCMVERFLSYLTDVIWCVSKSDELKAINEIGIKRNKIITSLNSITPLPGRDNRPCENKILFLGRLTHPKRPDLICKVVADNSQYKLDIVGAGDYYDSLVNKYSASDNIKFLGEINSFNRFNEYDVFVLTSDSEGLPMSALEAATAGLPLVLSNVGGCNEIIDRNGLLITNSEESLSAALENIFTNYDVFYSVAQDKKNKFDISSKKEEYSRIILGS
ncbi:glycosyltransferase [Yersinia enterocolitica]|uniref:glycosyltransferase n=2 Tax=Yersinia enterocolitica TaxID=630 RepID=UPI001C60F31A|nr:glycosyltransferase [Yersinia enterocolitica]EKN3564105.1 glycosyltransferase [Yersinia enterocolitica]EKN3595055.1 glycosyltransferase [Yersinia enterocolitica]EKN3988604.1 glycosyltransferase [Yersinia enterocolitica]EKN4069475.1 glycosyltransferase [Yersinia enterocolitica]EKN4114580.1 glycosyltransferase [Yersinia enterocolitica]